MVLRHIRNANLVFAISQDLTGDQNHFLQNLIKKTRDQVRSSRAYLDENDDGDIPMEDCFRPELAILLYSFTYKYVEIDITHLKSLLLRVKRELSLRRRLAVEGDSENKHVEEFKL